MTAPAGPAGTSGPDRSVRERPPRRALRWVGLAVVVAGGLVLGTGVATGILGSLAAELASSAVPSVSEGPSLPDDVTVVSTEKVCASGGCWVELTLRGPAGEAPGELLERLDVSSDETCRRSSAMWLWQVCTQALTRPGSLVVVLQYDPST
jgi:hypothetical protein